MERTRELKALIRIRQDQLFVLRAVRATAQSVLIQEKYLAVVIKLFEEGRPRDKDMMALRRANTLFNQCNDSVLELQDKTEKMCNVAAEMPQMGRLQRRRASREILKLRGKAQSMLNKVEEAHVGLQALRKRVRGMTGMSEAKLETRWTDHQENIMKRGIGS